LDALRAAIAEFASEHSAARRAAAAPAHPLQPT
jgi:hypothetical protein